MFSSVARGRVSQIAMQRIKESIEDGTFEIGAKLPTERELTEQLQVSRGSVREALRQLEALGLIEVRLGHGTFVRRRPNETGDAEGGEPLLPFQANIEDVVEVRVLIETKACSLAAQRATLEDLRAMQRALMEMREAVEAGDTAAAVLADSRFHLAISKASKNKLLTRLEGALAHELIESGRFTLGAEGVPSRALAMHQLIFEAIKAKDGDWASSLMLSHIRMVEQRARGVRSDEEEAQQMAAWSAAMELPRRAKTKLSL